TTGTGTNHAPPCTLLPHGHHCVTAVEIATGPFGYFGDSITSVALSLEHDLHLPDPRYARVLTNPPVESRHCVGGKATGSSLGRIRAGQPLGRARRLVLGVRSAAPVAEGKDRRSDGGAVALAGHRNGQLARVPLPVQQHEPASRQDSVSPGGLLEPPRACGHQHLPRWLWRRRHEDPAHCRLLARVGWPLCGTGRGGMEPLSGDPRIWSPPPTGLGHHR